MSSLVDDSPYLLSSIDNTLIEFSIPMLWAFASEEHSTPAGFETLARHLQRALEQTVDAHFPILNHPLCHSEELGYFIDRSVILRPVFQTAEALHHPPPHADIDANGNVWEPPTEAYQLGDLKQDPTRPHSLCFAMRVTRLNGGVAVLGLLSHIVGDAASLVNLMLAISKVAERGIEAVNITVTEDRQLLRGAAGRPPSEVPVECRARVPQSVLVDSLMKMCDDNEAKKVRPYRHRYTRAEIDELKGQLAGDLDFAPTANDIVLALTLARGAKNMPAEAPLGLLFPANMRGRCPNIPNDYFGNAVLCCISEQSTAGAFAEASLPELVRLVNKAKLQCATQSHVDDLINWEAGQVTKTRGFCVTEWPCLAVTNWAHFPFFDVSLTIGTPLVVTPAYNGWINLIGYIMPTPPGHGGAIDLIFTPPAVDADAESWSGPRAGADA